MLAVCMPDDHYTKVATAVLAGDRLSVEYFLGAGKREYNRILDEIWRLSGKRHIPRNHTVDEVIAMMTGNS
jgi:hypothetical protein